MARPASSPPANAPDLDRKLSLATALGLHRRACGRSSIYDPAAKNHILIFLPGGQNRTAAQLCKFGRDGRRHSAKPSPYLAPAIGRLLLRMYGLEADFQYI